MRLLNQPLLLSLLFTVLLTMPLSADNEDRKCMDLCGLWRAALDPNRQLSPTSRLPITVSLPGTTDTNGIGYAPSDTTETTRLTRRHHFAGRVWYSREVDIPVSWRDKIVMLTLERTKTTAIYVDGHYCGGSNNIVAPQTFDLTVALRPGRHQLTISVDNAAGLPSQLYSASHQLCEDTQTNWNGIIGAIRLKAINPCHFTSMQLLGSNGTTRTLVLQWTGKPARQVQLRLTITTADQKQTLLRLTPLHGKALQRQHTLHLPLDLSQLAAWSEWQPTTYRLRAELTGCDAIEQTFGLTKFSVHDGHFTVNGHPTFLRGKHDACVFPLTAHTSMDKSTWTRYMDICKQYGINHIRFHSWCPPEAAFDVADSLGLYLQPELPFWGNFDKNDTTLMRYLMEAGRLILNNYGHHPSFRMMALGNELWGDIPTMKAFVDTFRVMAPDKLYTFGSNYYLGYHGIDKGMDYVTTCRTRGEAWGQYHTNTRASFSYADVCRGGIINTSRPSTNLNFNEACDTVSIPLIGHETGQYQTYPDYREIAKYTGVLAPYNLQVFRSRLEQAGMGPLADAFHQASGQWSKELYKADIEMNLRTRHMAGFQLLDLQDYPGQGSAYVGMLDAFMDSKQLTTPAEWRQWCNSIVPLLGMDSLCFANSDTLRAHVQVANYSGQTLSNLGLLCELRDGDSVLAQTQCGNGTYREGLTSQGDICLPLNMISNAKALTLTVTFIDDTGYPQPGLGHNSYKVWVYPASVNKVAAAIGQRRRGVLVTHHVDKALKAAWEGGTVLLTSDSLSNIGPLFTTDYWNYRMFKTICEKNHKEVSPGTLGLYVAHPQHPLFSCFPTDSHTSWQWFSVVNASSPVVLDDLPTDYRPIIQVIDNVERNHRLGLVFEAKVGKGKLLVCAANLDQAMCTVEGRAFCQSLLSYLQSEAFQPATALSATALRHILQGARKGPQLKKLDNISQY